MRLYSMLWWFIPLILFCLSALVIIGIVLWKLPQVRLIDPKSLPKEQLREMKEKLILNRVARLRSAKFGKFGKALHATFREASKSGRRAVQRLHALEEYYEHLKQVSGEGDAADAQTIKKLMYDAEELMRQEEYALAEKKLIEVISHCPKHVEAYEALGNLYLKSKNYEQARETLEFALKLGPEDASVHMSLAELEMKLEHPAGALEAARAAVEKRPNNPKYLDMFVRAALLSESAEDAKDGIAKLKAANPQNNKIDEFEARLAEL